MRMGEFSSGLVTSKGQRKLPLNLTRRHYNLLHNTISQCRVCRLQAQHVHPKLKDDNSPSCSVTWWTPRNSPPNSIPKTIGTWYVHTKKSALQSSSDTMDTPLNS